MLIFFCIFIYICWFIWRRKNVKSKWYSSSHEAPPNGGCGVQVGSYILFLFWEQISNKNVRRFLVLFGTLKEKCVDTNFFMFLKKNVENSKKCVEDRKMCCFLTIWQFHAFLQKKGKFIKKIPEKCVEHRILLNLFNNWKIRRISPKKKEKCVEDPIYIDFHAFF